MTTTNTATLASDGTQLPLGWALYAGFADEFSVSFSHEKRFRNGECLLLWQEEAGGWGFCVDEGSTRLHKSKAEFPTVRAAANAAEALLPELLPKLVEAVTDRRPRLALTTNELAMCLMAGGGNCVKCGIATSRYLMEDGEPVCYCGRCAKETTG